MSPSVEPVTRVASAVKSVRAPRVRARRLLDTRVDQLPDVPYNNPKKLAQYLVRTELGFPSSDRFVLKEHLVD